MILFNGNLVEHRCTPKNAFRRPNQLQSSAMTSIVSEGGAGCELAHVHDISCTKCDAQTAVRDNYNLLRAMRLSSSRPSDARCTSSGPSASRSVRASAYSCASGVSAETPAPPCTWIAASSMASTTLGASTCGDQRITANTSASGVLPARLVQTMLMTSTCMAMHHVQAVCTNTTWVKELLAVNKQVHTLAAVIWLRAALLPTLSSASAAASTVHLHDAA